MTAHVRPLFDRIPIELVAQVFTSGFMSRHYHYSARGCGPGASRELVRLAGSFKRLRPLFAPTHSRDCSHSSKANSALNSPSLRIRSIISVSSCAVSIGKAALVSPPT